MPAFEFTEVTCVADANKPEMVRVAVQTNQPPPSGKVLWAEVSSGEVTRQGQMKKLGKGFILSPVNLSEDPVTVYVKLVPQGKPKPIFAEVTEVFDLARELN
jgi:hypothetical protein